MCFTRDLCSGLRIAPLKPFNIRCEKVDITEISVTSESQNLRKTFLHCPLKILSCIRAMLWRMVICKYFDYVTAPPSRTAEYLNEFYLVFVFPIFHNDKRINQITIFRKEDQLSFLVLSHKKLSFKG